MAIMTRKRRRMIAEATAVSPSAVLPEELMIEILSRVEVSNPLQLRCVCKWWKSLVLDPEFVKKHLHRSLTEITDLASTATDSIDAFELQLSYAAPTVPHDEDETDLEDTDDEEDEAEEEEEQQQENGDDVDEEEEEEEGEEKRLVMNLATRLDNLLLVIRSMKVSLQKIKGEVKAVQDRMKCLQSFLRIYLKTAAGNASSSSSP